MNKQNVLLLILCCFCAIEIYGMDNQRNQITYIAFLNEDHLVINSTNNCVKKNIITQESEIVHEWQTDKYFYCTASPGQPVILSDNSSLIIFRSNGEKQTIELNVRLDNKNIIRCLFNAHTSTILCQKLQDFFYVDPKSSKVKDLGEWNSQEDCPWFKIIKSLQIPVNPCFSVHPTKNELCVGKLNLYVSINNGNDLSVKNIIHQAVNPSEDNPEKGFSSPLLCGYNYDGSYIICLEDSFSNGRNPMRIFKISDQNKVEKEDCFYPPTDQQDLRSGFIGASIHPYKNIVATLLYLTSNTQATRLQLLLWDFVTKKNFFNKILFDNQEISAQSGDYDLSFSPNGEKIVVLNKKINDYLMVSTHSSEI